MSEGLSNKQIARHLGIRDATRRDATVKNHVHSILGKLGVQRRGEAVARFHGADGPARQRNGMDHSIHAAAAHSSPPV